MIPNSNLSGLPQITETHLKSNDPSVLNRVLRLFATQINGLQTKIPTVAGITGTAEVVSAATSSSTSSGGGSGSSSSKIITAQGTHVERLSIYLAPDQPVGCYFYETDRTVFYLNYLTAGNVQQWLWASGTMYGVFSVRPADLGIYDAGFLFYATDRLLEYRWTGSAWVELNLIEPVLQDTHANRLANYPSVYYAPNTLFYETDRQIFYIAQTISGTVTVTTGTTVTWVSGNKFVNTGTGFTAAQYPAGTPITINGVATTISVAGSATSITLQAAVANGVGVAYSITSGRWAYASGQQVAAWASLPTDLGEVDNLMTFFDNTNSLHIWQWTGAAYTWGPGDRHSGEFAQFDADPGVGWHSCDGAVNQTKYAANGTRVTNFTVPDQREFYLKTSATYTGVGVAAVAPTITPAANTGSSVTGITLAATTGNDSGSQAVSVGVGATVPAEPHTHNSPSVNDPGHTHTIGSITAGTNGVPATFAVLPFYRL